MSRTIYFSSVPYRYYLISITGKAYEVSENEFFSVVGMNRAAVPMYYDSGNINRQCFYLCGELIGFRERR